MYVCMYVCIVLMMCDCTMCQVEVNNGKVKMIHRTYHDLLWLHRNLARRVELGGYIVSHTPYFLVTTQPLCKHRQC